MPEFVLNIGETGNDHARFAELDSFTQGYIEAMFFTAVDWEDKDASGNPNDTPDWSFAMLAPDALARIVADCDAFQKANAALLESAYDHGGRRGDYDAEAAGRDYWYSRNGHGVGYWDRDLGDIGDKLDAAAGRSECDLYRGDDGRLYLH